MNRISAAATSAAIVATCAGLAHAQFRGPSSAQTAYVVPAAPGVNTYSIFTVGDQVGGYKMVGIPDGLGALDNGDGTFTTFMNHELGGTSGVTRAHGSKGAFVSEWRIDKATGAVLSGNDLIQSVNTWNGGGYTNGTATFNRFCSANLADQSAFYNPATGLGTTERLFMNGEEAGNEGRAWAHVASGANKGQSWELPSLGKLSWENAVAAPKSGNRTVVIGTDDSTPGQVYVYAGNKTAAGTEVQRAGLTNGQVFGIKVSGVTAESRTSGLGSNSATFSLAALGDATNKTGAQLDTESTAAGVTQFLRPEDGAFDPNNPNNFYFVTTDRFDSVKTGEGSQVGRSRLWRMSFTDITQPELGGNIDMLLDGSESQQMMDNICLDKWGNILIQEDPGNQAISARVWNYNIASDSLTLLAKHDTARFGDLGIGATAPFTTDEESSGIIDASDILGPGWFLLDVQAHYGITGELVEGGQLVALFNPASVPAPGAMGLAMIAAAVAGRRRR